ncbi:putative thiosulfate/polysulfide reductase, molybdenum-binding subunit [Campylobacter pinnipediorum subsp. caledonicus]|uniref:Putative thiosulfate/polysulfide reductase, molybdenum-binding subunit n=1 Tax=Campylobacter pinnipediorum subsp. caledonicus TaxID=1874362 RepID=A0A1S6U6J7_9BACT|nr:thiosulfate reductase PhsA [Campylobacter pinnipediorum]AQW87300.1 putative thiosulfate/polysulfide reductase, molybdenum-binding subunit [Campylobacter pinnipediorum subsp. caledonicus]
MDFSRRNFLKSTATAGAAAACITPGSLASVGAGALKGSESFTRSFCEMCSTRCPIEGRVVDGKNVFIQGNSKASGTKTSICARGGSGHNQLYDPERIVKPLIRAGERGEGKWREASWEEALDLVATKMNEIKQKYGPESFVFTCKSSDTHKLMTNFAHSYGSPNVFSHLSCCPITYQMVCSHMYGDAKLKRDYGNAKYIVNFGHNLFEGIVISDAKKLAKFADKKDTKLLVLEPRFSVVASKADEWLPVKPGTDIAFVMSLIHTWIKRDTYDKKFIQDFTIGFDKVVEATKDTTPQWQEKITGIPAETVERIATEIWKAAPRVIIDFGHKTTTTRAEYMRTRAIMVANAMMGNWEVKGGLFSGKKAKTFNKLTGTSDFPEITNPDKNFKAPKVKRIDFAGEDGKHKFIGKNHGVLMDIADSILSEKPYPVKGWFNIRFNHLINVAGTDKSIEALKKLDFIVVSDIYLNDMATFADVILPESTYLERDEGIQDKSSQKPAYMIRNKIVEPIGDTKDGASIFRELARKMKIDQNYTWDTIRDWRMQQVKGNVDLLATLEKDGYITWKVPGILYREKDSVDKFVKTFPYASKFVGANGLMDEMAKLKTKSGKIELFSEDVEKQFPGYGCLNTNDIDVFEGHELCLTNGKTPIHTNGHTQNIPFLNDMMKSAPIWINPRTAAKKGLKDGDDVFLQNKHGKEKGKVFITEGIREDTLFVYHGFGHITPGMTRTNGIGTNDSKLLNPAEGLVAGTMVTNVGVDIVKA